MQLEVSVLSTKYVLKRPNSHIKTQFPTTHTTYSSSSWSVDRKTLISKDYLLCRLDLVQDECVAPSVYCTERDVRAE